MKFLIIRGLGAEKNNDLGWFYNKTLESMGHKTRVFEHRDSVNSNLVLLMKFLKKDWINLYKRADKKLLTIAREFKPDFILDVCGKSTSSELIKKLKMVTGAPVVCRFVDNPLFYDPPLTTMPIYDHFFIKDSYVLKELKKIGANNVHYLPQAFHPDYHRPVKMTSNERKIYGSDISLVGSMYPYRIRILETLKDYDMKIWGSSASGTLRNSPLFEYYQNRSVVHREKSMVFNASKINMNTHNMQNDIYGVNVRAFELQGAGGFQLLDYKKDISKVFEPGKELVTFKTKTELKKKVDYYLDRPKKRNRIAKRGRKRALKEHTYKHRILQILKTCKV